MRPKETRRARQQHTRPIATSSTVVVVVVVPTSIATIHAAATAATAAAAAAAFTAAALAGHLHGRRLRLSHPKGRRARRATRIPIPRTPFARSSAIFAAVAVTTTVTGAPLRHGGRTARWRPTAQRGGGAPEPHLRLTP